MFGRKKASKKVGRKKVGTKKAATKKSGPISKKKLKRDLATRELKRTQKMLDRPSTYENYGRRVSRKSDKLGLEGNELSQGTGVRTRSGSVRQLTKGEATRLQSARRAKYRRNTENDVYRRRNAAADTLQKMRKKRKKKK